MAGQCDEAEVLIVDPPRRGLNEKMTQYLTNKLEEKSLTKGNLM